MKKEIKEIGYFWFDHCFLRGTGIEKDIEKYIDRAYDKINEPIAKCVTYNGINHRGNY